MKEIKVVINQNNKVISSKYFNINDNIDICNNKEIEQKLIKLDIFKYLDNDNDFNIKENFIVTIYTNNTENTLEMKFFRYYNDTLFNNEKDFYLYGKNYFVKQELLNRVDNEQIKDFIFPYNYKNKYLNINKRLLFGFELEISCGVSNNLKLLVKNLIEKDLLKNNKIILKNDSSIHGNNTVEIVTEPMEMKKLKKTASELASIFKKFDISAKGHNMGGMHVHCSYVLNNIRISRLIQFIYKNSNYDFIAKIAQRTNNQYCQFKLENIATAIELLELTTSDTQKNFLNKDRYSALNFTNNTIEFRIFNSNLREERILKNLNFVESILDYTKKKKFTTNFEDFSNFVMKSHKYKYLKDYVKYLNEQ